MNSLEELTYYCSLFDLYKSLLTDKQRDIMEKHLYYDLSLNEIAQDLGISRAGVLDSIEHSKDNLKSYEGKLHLFERNEKLSKKISESNLSNEEKKELIEVIYYGI